MFSHAADVIRRIRLPKSMFFFLIFPPDAVSSRCGPIKKCGEYTKHSPARVSSVDPTHTKVCSEICCMFDKAVGADKPNVVGVLPSPTRSNIYWFKLVKGLASLARPASDGGFYRSFASLAEEDLLGCDWVRIGDRFLACSKKTDVQL